MATAEPLRVSRLGLASAAVALATDAYYLSVITSQGDPHNLDRVVVVATAIAAGGTAALAGSLARAPGVRALFLSASAAILVVWGAIGAFSIGGLLFVAGVLAAIAAARVPGVGVIAASALAIAAAVVVLSIAALVLT